jgi:hypothetical protein
MVLEQVLTIIFAAGVGAAVIGYAVRPRNRGASISVGPSAGPSGIGSFSPAETVVQAAPMPQIAAVETPVVETSSPEVNALPSVSEVVPVVAEVAAAGPVEVASIATEMVSPSSAAPVSIAETVEAPATVAASVPKAPRKRSTSTKPRAKSTRKAKTTVTPA